MQVSGNSMFGAENFFVEILTELYNIEDFEVQEKGVIL